MKISHPHPTISSTSGQTERRKSLSPGGQKISSASYEALSPLAFTNLCGEIQDYLSEPEVEIVDRQILGGGLNGSYIVTLSNGLVATWKPDHESHKLEERDNLEAEAHNAAREAFCYDIDAALGHLAHVYPCVQRELQDAQTGESHTGALQFFLPDTPSLRSYSRPWPISFAQLPLIKRQNLAAFDEVTGQLDRHDGNLLLHGIPIDHGICLPLHNGFQGSFNAMQDKSVPLSRTQMEALELLREAGSRELKDLLSAHQLPLEIQEPLQERVCRALETETASFWWRQGTNLLSET